MKLFNIQITDLNKKQILQIIEKYLYSHSFHHIATVNPEFLVESQRNKKFKNILQNCDLNIADGFGIIIGAFFTGQKIPVRIPGVDLLYDIIELCAQTDKKIIFFGGKEGVGEKAKNKILKKYKNIKIKVVSGGKIIYDKQGNIIQNINNLQKINEFNPDVIFVGLGHPKQELWLAKNYGKIKSLKIGIGVGGSFDFIAGNITRAPKIMRKIGLEWLFRLIKQPYRIKRIFEATIVYLWLIFKYHYLNNNKNE